MTFDVEAYLRAHSRIDQAYGDERVVPCVCDAGTNGAHLWVNVTKRKALCYRCGLACNNAVDIVQHAGNVNRLLALQIVESGSSASGWHELMSLLTETTLEKEEDCVESIELPEEFEPVTLTSKLHPYLEARVGRQRCLRYQIGVCHRGYFAHRVIVPVTDAVGTLVSFVARQLGDPPQGVRKVLYPKGSKIHRVLFSESRAQDFTNVAVTEGVFDAIAAGGRAVALFGKQASRYQINRLINLGAERVLHVMLDRDAEEEARALAEHLGQHCDRVKLVTLPEGKKDPGECTAREIYRAMMAAERVGHRLTQLATYLET